MNGTQVIRLYTHLFKPTEAIKSTVISNKNENIEECFFFICKQSEREC